MVRQLYLGDKKRTGRRDIDSGGRGRWKYGENGRGEIFMKCDKMWEMWENNGKEMGHMEAFSMPCTVGA